MGIELILPLAVQLLKVIEQAQISLNTAPEAYREQYFARLQKWEQFWDRVFGPVGDAILASLPKEKTGGPA